MCGQQRANSRSNIHNGEHTCNYPRLNGTNFTNEGGKKGKLGLTMGVTLEELVNGFGCSVGRNVTQGKWWSTVVSTLFEGLKIFLCNYARARVGLFTSQRVTPPAVLLLSFSLTWRWMSSSSAIHPLNAAAACIFIFDNGPSLSIRV